MTDDAALVRLCLEGNEQGARELVERFQSMVFAVCVKMLSQREDAEDVTQDVFLRVFRALRSWDPTRPLQPWILAIAANRCRTALRQRPRDAARSSVEISRIVASGAGDSRELSDELDLAVAALREDYRLCFVLFYQQELSCAEIASVLDRPEGTVKTWLHRAARAGRTSAASWSGEQCRLSIARSLAASWPNLSNDVRRSTWPSCANMPGHAHSAASCGSTR